MSQCYDRQQIITFIMTSGGMQCVSSSYSRALTSNNLGQREFKQTFRFGKHTNKLQLLSGLDGFDRSPLPLRALLAYDGVSCFS